MIFGDYCYFCDKGPDGVETNLGCTGDELSRVILFTDKTGFYKHSYEPWDRCVFWCGVCEPGLIYMYKEKTEAELLDSLEADFKYLVFSPIYAFASGFKDNNFPKDLPGAHLDKVNTYDTFLLRKKELKRRLIDV